MSHRAERVGDRIRAELARMLREDVRDPRIGFVTVTGVQLSADLREARVFVSILDDAAEATLDALNHAVPFLRRQLAREAGLRFTPQLRFIHDRSLESGNRVERILERLQSQAPPEDEESR